MSDDEQSYSMEELVKKSATPVRTIRFYIAEDLLPRPVARGKGASYGPEHLLRLRLIRRLSEQRVPLAKIRDRLAQLSLSDIQELLRAEDRRSVEFQVAEQGASAKEYVSALLNRSRLARSSTAPSLLPPDPGAVASPIPDRLDSGRPASAEPSQPSDADLPWRRLELAPGVELHIRADAAVRFRRLIERLLKQAGKPVDRLDRSLSHGAVQSKED